MGKWVGREGIGVERRSRETGRGAERGEWVWREGRRGVERGKGMWRGGKGKGVWRGRRGRKCGEGGF